MTPEEIKQYAKQQAIAFYYFTMWSKEKDHWFNKEGDIIDLDAVYQEFEKQQNNQP